MIYQAINQWTETTIWILFFIALLASAFLALTTTPLIKEMEQSSRLSAIQVKNREFGYFLKRVEEKYKELVSTVDNINASHFCNSEMHSLRVKILFINVSAAKIQDFISQAPALLISFGLLGTFAGLTGGLGEIQTVLRPEISAQEAASGLSEVIAPMSLAFRTSLLGLILSLALSIIYQLTGWRNLLDSCEGLLVGWLETTLPIRIGKQAITPLRSSIDALNKTSSQLPEIISSTTEIAIKNAFGEKLDQFFDLYAKLANEVTRITNALTHLTSSLEESGSDFLSASEIFSNSSFASELGNAVASLDVSKHDLVQASQLLCERFATFREGLQATQTDIQILNTLAASELKKSNQLMDITADQNKEITHLIKSTNERGQEIIDATKELRSARLACGRDSKVFQKTAQALQMRFKSDEELSESCTEFIDHLRICLNNWTNSSSEILNAFESTIVKSADQLQVLTSDYQKEIGSHGRACNEMLDKHKEDLVDLIDKKEQLTDLIQLQHDEMRGVITSLSEQKNIINQLILRQSQYDLKNKPSNDYA